MNVVAVAIALVIIAFFYFVTGYSLVIELTPPAKPPAPSQSDPQKRGSVDGKVKDLLFNLSEKTYD